MKKIILIFFTIILLYANQVFDNQKKFSLIYGGASTAFKGDMGFTGAPVMCVKNDNDECDWNYQGYLYEANGKYLNIESFNLNSSDAIIHIPNNVTIKWAGLFWQGHIWKIDTRKNHPTKADYNAMIDGYNSVTVKINNSSLENITTNKNKCGSYGFIENDNYYTYDGNYYNGARFFYECYYDENSTNNSKIIRFLHPGDNEIVVGNIKSTDGEDQYIGDPLENWGLVKYGPWGGWTLVVVYKYPDSSNHPFKTFSIYNGFKKLIPPFKQNSQECIDINLTDFYTPKTGNVNANMLFFAAGGEKKMHWDSLQLKNKNGHFIDVNNSDNHSDDQFNDTISKFGNDINSTKIYNPGIDVDLFEVGVNGSGNEIIGNSQTKTTMKLCARANTQKGDQSFPSLIAFSTQLYNPHFCYDYAYSQNGIYFTEPYNPTTSPRIIGNVIPNNDINVSIYIKNIENSDIEIKDMKFNIIDLNQSQLDFNPNSVYLFDSNTNSYRHISDDEFNVFTDGNETNITNIPEGNVTSNTYKYLYFAFKALKDEVNQSMKKWYISYKYSVNGQNFNYTLKTELGSPDLPICIDHFEYNPAWNQFNIVDKKLYDGSNSKYNLFTQVVGRSHPYKTVSYDKTNLNQPKNYKYAVTVEMINVGGFHDINATCMNPYALNYPISNQSYLSKYLPVDFNNNEDVDINITPVSAVQNSAFRINFVDWNELFNNKNFSCDDTSDYKGMPKCISSNKNNYETIFGSNSPCIVDNGGPCFDTNNNDTYACLKCTLKYYGNRVCSRDNFSVRPDSFYIKIKDPVTNSLISDDLNNNEANMSAGVSYKIEINATKYGSLNSATGYTGFFGNFRDKNISLIWNSDKNSSVCADTSNKVIKKYVLNGVVSSEINNSEIGEYNFTVFDKFWTRADWDSNYLGHHNNSHFYAGADCDINKSTTQIAGNDVVVSGSSVDSSTLNGCIITNKNHYAPGINKTFKDINITFVPNKFKLLMNDSYGIVNDTNQTGWLYNTDIINYPNDENNSYKISGQIIAVNGKGQVTKNFTNGCFARDINVTINSIANDYTLPMQYVIYENNNTRNTSEANNNFIFLYSKANFTKSNQGVANITIKMNYKKIFNKTHLPIEVNFTDINVSNNLSYELNGTKTVTGKKDLNKTIEFRYGRIDASNITGYPQKVGNLYKLKGTFKYEYWTFNGWVLNKNHNSSNYGDINITSSYHPNVLIIKGPIIQGEENITLSTMHSLPYSAKIHLSIPSWLWSHPLAKNYQDPNGGTNLNCLTHPCFKVNFLKESLGWGGIGINKPKYQESNRTTEINASLKKININKKTLRKINW